MVIYLDPFRMIDSKTVGEWTASIEQINRGDWDCRLFRGGKMECVST